MGRANVGSPSQLQPAGTVAFAGAVAFAARGDVGGGGRGGEDGDPPPPPPGVRMGVDIPTDFPNGDMCAGDDATAWAPTVPVPLVSRATTSSFTGSGAAEKETHESIVPTAAGGNWYSTVKRPRAAQSRSAPRFVFGRMRGDLRGGPPSGSGATAGGGGSAGAPPGGDVAKFGAGVPGVRGVAPGDAFAVSRALLAPFATELRTLASSTAKRARPPRPPVAACAAVASAAAYTTAPDTRTRAARTRAPSAHRREPSALSAGTRSAASAVTNALRSRSASSAAPTTTASISPATLHVRLSSRAACDAPSTMAWYATASASGLRD